MHSLAAPEVKEEKHKILFSQRIEVIVLIRSLILKLKSNFKLWFAFFLCY